MNTKTRKQYLDGEISHDEYYSQFVTPEIRQAVASRFSPGRLRDAGQHFNGIPIAQWDNVGLQFHTELRKAFREAGDVISLSGVLCVLKRAAKDLV